MTALSHFFGDFYVQLYLIIGFAVFVLPFLILRRVPNSWKSYGNPYRMLLFVLVVLLWPYPVITLFVRAFQMLREYYRIRRLAKQAMQDFLDDVIREEARRVVIAKVREAAAKQREANAE